MTLGQRAKIDNKVMSVMKISEIRHIIAHTNKGDLCLMLPYNGTERDYKFVLDAVPYDEKTNKELLQSFDDILFDL